MKKLLLSLMVLLSIALIPTVVSSKENKPETLTLTGDNLLVLNSEVNGDSVGAIIKKAKALDAAMSKGHEYGPKKPLYLYLYSPGGSVMSGLQLREALRGLGRPVHTITAFSASMAFQLAESLDTRYILESGILMSHRAAGGFQGSFGGTSPSQLENRVHIWTQITKEMDENVVSRTNGKQTMESYQKAYANELWMTGQEAVFGGYADQIVRVRCGKGLEGTTKHFAEFFGMSIEYQIDNCPLNSSPTEAKVVSPPNVSTEYANKILSQFLTSYEMKAKSSLPLEL